VARFGTARLGREHWPLLLHYCGNVFTEALPINSLSKSVTIILDIGFFCILYTTSLIRVTTSYGPSYED
jgi:hypothetical protein